MVIKIDTDSKPVHLMSFLVLWKVRHVKMRVSTPRRVLKEKVWQKSKLLFYQIVGKVFMKKSKPSSNHLLDLK